MFFTSSPLCLSPKFKGVLIAIQIIGVSIVSERVDDTYRGKVNNIDRFATRRALPEFLDRSYFTIISRTRSFRVVQIGETRVEEASYSPNIKRLSESTTL